MIRRYVYINIYIYIIMIIAILFNIMHIYKIQESKYIRLKACIQLCRHNSCATLKPIHYPLVSNFNQPSEFYTNFRNLDENLNKFLVEQRQNILKFIFFQVRQAFFIAFGKTLSLVKDDKNISHGVRSRLHGRHCCSSTPNPPIAKSLLKPRMNSKCRIC